MRRFAIYKADTLEAVTDVRTDKANFGGFCAVLRSAEAYKGKVLVAVYQEGELPPAVILDSDRHRIVYRTGRGGSQVRNESLPRQGL